MSPVKMKFDLVKLPFDEKVEINHELDPTKLEMGFDDFQYKANLKVHGFVEKMSDVLVFSGTLTSTAAQVCGRCLEEIALTVDEPFDFAYDIKGKTEIDVTEDIREVMIISHPQRFLCKEDCKGLCPGCGVNMNIEPCKCKKQKVTERNHA